MRLFFLLLLSVLLLSSSKAAEPWSERLKDWLPDFITEWWWSDEESSETITDETLAALPGAEEWLKLPTAAENNFQFQWPLATVDAEQDARRFAAARANTVVYQDGNDYLPIGGGTPLRLIYGQGGYPLYFANVLQTFSPVTSLEYSSDRDQELVPLARPEVVNVLYVRPQDFEVTVAPWIYDFAELPVVLVYAGDPADLPLLPKQWITIKMSGANATGQVAAANLLFNAQSDQDSALLAYAQPQDAGLDAALMEKTDYYINQAIRRYATPGAQLLVTKGGKIVYQKAYGYHTYNKQQEVFTSDQYDLASVTKSAATSLAVMLLFEDGKIDLKEQVRVYLPEYKRHAIGRYTIEQLLTHQTGLQASLPVQKYLGKTYVSKDFKNDFTIPISENRWLDESVPGKVIGRLKYVDRTRRRIYRYSDVNYVLLQQVVERINGRPINELLQERIYTPLGLQRLGFRPTERFAAEQTVPTSRDKWMRGGLIRGFVHDEGAALLGGVAGHAGLFGTATDLAQLFQMLLNGGQYNGQQIFSEATVALFTARSRYNYRALAFDRLDGGYHNVVNAGASSATFGHTGFSGTCVWADPENDLIFVLLTNRIHPDPANERFNKMSVRAKVHRQVYRSFLEEEQLLTK